MPQDIDFFMPFPERISPDVDGARSRSLAWVRRKGLITSLADEDRIRAWDIAGLMARWIPGATGPDLDPAVENVLLVTMLDDQFDTPHRRELEEYARICGHLAELVRPASTTVANGPFALALKEVWDRLCAGASPLWIQRAADHYCCYLDGTLAEAHNRVRRTTPSLDEFMAQRRKSGYVEAMLDLSQKAYGFELPPEAYDDPTFTRMLEITVDFVDTVNDVHSLEKEEARGQERDNLVHVIMRETGCSRDQSITRITRMAEAWIREFIELERGIGIGSVLHRFVDCMRSVIRGYLDWSRATERYSMIVSAAEPAYGNVLPT